MNTSQGIITDIRQTGIFHILDLDVNNVKIKVFTLQLNECFQVGGEVELLFKETAPLLVKGDENAMVSAANNISAKVRNIINGELFAEVELESSIGVFSSLLTMDVINSFDLKIGDDLKAFIKASDISIGRI